MNIEEIAFKGRKNLVQLNENDLLDIIEFLQYDRKQWINQFTQTHNESVKIQEENQELKDNWVGNRKEVIVMNKEIISKIKEKAYENVNKKLEEERKKTERKINDEIEVVEEILKYIKNKLIFKKVGDNWRKNYVLVTEDIFFEDYNSEPEYNWQKGIEIKHEREKKWDYFIKVNGQFYYDVRYIIANYEEEYEILKRRLSDLKGKFREIEEQERGLLALEPKIKKLLEQYQEVEIEENK